MLSRFVIAFLPRSKCLLISCLQSLSIVILEPKKIKSVIASTFSPSICHEVMGPDAMVLVFCMLSFKPTFWLKKVRNLCHPYSATPANQSEILSNLLQIHFTSCPFYCHPGGVGFHYVTLRL